MIFAAFFLLLCLCCAVFFYGTGWKVSPLTLSIFFFLPVIALSLYLFLGHPSCPSGIARLRPQMPEKISKILQILSEQAAQTPDNILRAERYRFLAELSWRANNRSSALSFWEKSLQSHFSPEASIELAEAETETAGYVTQSAQNLYSKALKAHKSSPKDTPPQWMKIAKMRLIQAEQERQKEGEEALLLPSAGASS